MPVRLNLRSLSSQQKHDFVQSVLILKSKGIYDEYVKLHSEAMMRPAGRNARNFAHFGPIFLPWHREFLRRFETDLQTNGEHPNVTIPYWDWTDDAVLQNPGGSPIWSEDFMGGDGDPQANFTVQTGPFAANKWTALRSNGSLIPLIRQFGLDPDGSSLPTENDVHAAMNQMPYDSLNWDMFSTQGFRNYLEGFVPNPDSGLHNRVHIWVGGIMATGGSPGDPVFFLHHSNIDRIWASWQEKHFADVNESYLPSEPIMDNGSVISGHSINEYMFPWIKDNNISEGLRGGSVILKNVLNHRKLGYTYEKYVD